MRKIKINNEVEVRNRLAIAPLTLFACNPDDSIKDEVRDYLKLRGTDLGLYITGATSVNDETITNDSLPRA